MVEGEPACNGVRTDAGLELFQRRRKVVEIRATRVWCEVDVSGRRYRCALCDRREGPDNDVMDTVLVEDRDDPRGVERGSETGSTGRGLSVSPRLHCARAQSVGRVVSVLSAIGGLQDSRAPRHGGRDARDEDEARGLRPRAGVPGSEGLAAVDRARTPRSSSPGPRLSRRVVAE
jgi:hypothetical protein